MTPRERAEAIVTKWNLDAPYLWGEKASEIVDDIERAITLPLQPAEDWKRFMNYRAVRNPEAYARPNVQPNPTQTVKQIRTDTPRPRKTATRPGKEERTWRAGGLGRTRETDGERLGR